MPHSVLLVDDHKIMRDGIKAILERSEEFQVIGEAENGMDALRLCKSDHPQIILMDIGLPGLNGFVGEIMCLFGIFKANQVWAILGVTTVIIAAAYLLWMYQRVMHGPITNNRVKSFPDMNKREILYLVPIVIMMFWMGIYPQTFLRKMDVSVDNLIKLVEKKKTLFIDAKKETIVLPDTVIAKDKSLDQDKDKEDKI